MGDCCGFVPPRAAIYVSEMVCVLEGGGEGVKMLFKGWL